MTVVATKPLRAVLYGRVSAAGSDGRSVESQLVECRRVAEREGWRYVEHRDDGISASRYARGKARPGWQAVMDEITGARVDVLVVWEISRASRDRAVWAALLAACHEAHVRLAVGGKLHDPADPDDGFMLDLSAALAVRESDMTSKRTKRHLEARARDGAPHGRVPYGYARTYDDHSGRPTGQVIDPETGDVVREIARRILRGDSCYSIAKDLNARAVPSPLMVTRARNGKPVPEPIPWRPEQVRRVAEAPTNAGIRVLRGEPLPGIEARWEPLILRADHAKIVEIFADPRRRTNTGDSAAKYLLSGIALCGVCGAVVRRVKNRTVPSYSCSRGFHVARAIHLTDAYVGEVVLARLERSDAAELFTEANSDERAAQDAARVELAELRARLDEWYAAAAEGVVTPSGLAKIESGLLPKIDEAEGRATPRPSSPVLRDLLGGNVRERWEQTPIPTRREVVRELMTVRIHKTTQGRRRLDPDSVGIEWRAKQAEEF